MDMPPIQYAHTDDGVDIAYAVLGREKPGPPVLFLNLMISAGLDALLASEVELAVLEPLLLKHSVVFFDWRGLGLSGDPSETTNAAGLISDVRAVHAAVRDGPVDILARGGLCHIAIRRAAESPGRVGRMALIQPSVPGVSPRVVARVGPLLPIAELDWDLFAEVTALLSFGWKDIHEARVFYERLRTRWNWKTWSELMDVLESLDASDVAALTDCPTLLHFTGSLPAPIRSLTAKIQRARVVVEPEQVDVRENTFARMDSVGYALAQTSWLPDAVIGFLESLPDAEVNGPGIDRTFRTILFTDVVASTPLLAQLKDEKMRAVMRDHDEVLEAAVTGHGGRVVKTIGDAFMAEFAVPSGAVEAAIAAQRGIRDKFADSDVPIRLRIGINAGEPIEEDGDLHGASVVIAKRLESEAENGGILVSDVVRSAVAGKEFEFVDRGEVTLKGFDEPVRAWSVPW